MTLQARPYQDTADYERMRQLLMAGTQAKLDTHYVHPGDLDWWVHRPPDEANRRRNILLWEAEDAADLVAWSLMVPDEGSFDLFVQPALRGTPVHERLFEQSLAWAEARTREAEPNHLQSYWIADYDKVMEHLLTAHGFVAEPNHSPHFECELDVLPMVALPDGFSVHGVGTLELGRQRAEATHGAFGAERPWEPYWKTYQQFMHSAAYEGEHDLVVVSPEGRGAAACMIWFDPVNAVGLFEPVGTHPDFQGKGLGKAVMAEGLRRMKVAGMKQAIVSTNHGNVAACALYGAMGFRQAFEFVSWKREI